MNILLVLHESEVITSPAATNLVMVAVRKFKLRMLKTENDVVSSDAKPLHQSQHPPSQIMFEFKQEAQIPKKAAQNKVQFGFILPRELHGLLVSLAVNQASFFLILKDPLRDLTWIFQRSSALCWWFQTGESEDSQEDYEPRKYWMFLFLQNDNPPSTEIISPSKLSKSTRPFGMESEISFRSL